MKISTGVPLLCGFAAIVHLTALAQTNGPRDLLQRVRARVTDTLARLPRYMCGLTIERSEYASDPTHALSCDGLSAQSRLGQLNTRLAETDRLKLDVAIAAGGEIYSWPDENRFDKHDPFELVEGATENGVYSGFLSAIFGSDAADITYKGETSVSGRTLAEFEFRVPLDKSTYSFRDGASRYTTAYEGTFAVDPATADLVSLSIRSVGLPAESGACETGTTLDYSRIHLHDSDFLLPRQSQLDILRNDGSESRNRAVYASCREFTADSSIRFDGPAGGAVASPAAVQTEKAPAIALPVGRQFKVRFTEPVDTETASGGDVIKAVLETVVLDAKQKSVLVPKGSEIAARIMRLEHFPGPKPSIRIEVRLEAVMLGGTRVALAAKARPAIDAEEESRPAPLVRPGGTGVSLGLPPRALQKRPLLGRLHADPSVYVFEFRGEKPGFVVKAGLESNWVTVGEE